MGSSMLIAVGPRKTQKTVSSVNPTMGLLEVVGESSRGRRGGSSAVGWALRRPAEFLTGVQDPSSGAAEPTDGECHCRLSEVLCRT